MDGRELLAAAGVLFPDRQGRIMLVRVSYQAKHPIEIPGGGWEPGDESPRQTAIREIAEELGITPELGPLACVDWSRDSFRPPIAAFVYWAAPLTDRQLASLRLEADELGGYGFLTPGQVASALPPLLSRRVTACLQAPRAAGPLELEDGHPVGHTLDHLTPTPPPPYTGAAGLSFAGSGHPATPPPMDRATYIASRPRIRAKARVVFTDAAGRVLLVRTRHEPQAWILPGGSIEADRELPREAARREVHEELGWHREPGRLLGLDWAAGPQLVYVFDGGEIGPAELTSIRLPEAELTDWAMFPPQHARTELSPASWARLSSCLAARSSAATAGPLELVDGVPIGGPS